MELYYSPTNKTWFHHQKEVGYFIGSNQIPVSYRQAENNESIMNFHVRKKGKKLGPFIGILVQETPKGTIPLDFQLAERLAKEAFSKGGVVGLLPLGKWKNPFWEGYLFDNRRKIWVKGLFPFPDLFYNRIAKRKTEESPLFSDTFQASQTKGVPFFNPKFFDKYEIYLLLKESPELLSYLPETIFIKEKRELQSFLHRHKTIYLKPANHFKGSGVMVCKLLDKGIVVRNFQEKSFFSSFDSFWFTLKPTFQRFPYIAQKAIFPKKLKGRRYDFRVLAQLVQNRFKVTGIGVRWSAEHNITTHIPRGGRLLPYELFKNENLDAQIYGLVQKTGEKLIEKYGFVGEFTIDLGIDKKGEMKIFEVNSKPMSFDEKEIDRARIKHLYELFLHMTNFL